MTWIGQAACCSSTLKRSSSVSTQEYLSVYRISFHLFFLKKLLNINTEIISAKQST
uniref:BLTX776 n=1 Tax=Nephila pilipes TaxID=299642 RepID=A0A076KUR8_NEPPI|nr:BLTX776 [Nephila pilipes]